MHLKLVQFYIMRDTKIFLIILIIITAFFVYKIVKEIISFFDYKNGKILKGEILDIEWIKSPLTRLSYLYPKEQLRLLFKFEINNEFYEKYDNDIHFKYRKDNYKSIPKKGDIVDVYIPKSKNPNKVTDRKSVV